MSSGYPLPVASHGTTSAKEYSFVNQIEHDERYTHYKYVRMLGTQFTVGQNALFKFHSKRQAPSLVQHSAANTPEESSESVGSADHGRSSHSLRTEMDKPSQAVIDRERGFTPVVHIPSASSASKACGGSASSVNKDSIIFDYSDNTSSSHSSLLSQIPGVGGVGTLSTVLSTSNLLIAPPTIDFHDGTETTSDLIPNAPPPSKRVAEFLSKQSTSGAAGKSRRAPPSTGDDLSYEAMYPTKKVPRSELADASSATATLRDDSVSTTTGELPTLHQGELQLQDVSDDTKSDYQDIQASFHPEHPSFRDPSGRFQIGTITALIYDNQLKVPICVYKLYRFTPSSTTSLVQTDVYVATNVHNIHDHAFVVTAGEYLHAPRLPHEISPLPSHFAQLKPAFQPSLSWMGTDIDDNDNDGMMPTFSHEQQVYSCQHHQQQNNPRLIPLLYPSSDYAALLRYAAYINEHYTASPSSSSAAAAAASSSSEVDLDVSTGSTTTKIGDMSMSSSQASSSQVQMTSSTHHGHGHGHHGMGPLAPHAAKYRIRQEPQLLHLYHMVLEPGFLSVPKGHPLPGRAREFATIHQFLSQGLRTRRAGGSLLVSGLPGTGKTASVTQALQRIHKDQKALLHNRSGPEDEGAHPTRPDYRVLEINATRLSHPGGLYQMAIASLLGYDVQLSSAGDVVTTVTLPSKTSSNSGYETGKDTQQPSTTASTSTRRGRQSRRRTRSKRNAAALRDDPSSDDDGDDSTDDDTPTGQQQHHHHHHASTDLLSSDSFVPRFTSSQALKHLSNIFKGRHHYLRKYLHPALTSKLPHAPIGNADRYQPLPLQYTIIVVDEADYLLSRQQNELYQLLDFPSSQHFPLAIVLISNTFSLQDQTSRVISRVGLQTLSFEPYKMDDITAILYHRLGYANQQFKYCLLEYYRYLLETNQHHLIPSEITTVLNDQKTAIDYMTTEAVEVKKDMAATTKTNISGGSDGSASNETETDMNDKDDDDGNDDDDSDLFSSDEDGGGPERTRPSNKTMVRPLTEVLSPMSLRIVQKEHLGRVTQLNGAKKRPPTDKLAPAEKAILLTKEKINIESHRILLGSDALRFCAAKVAAISGDCRRALAVCQKALQVAAMVAHLQTAPSDSTQLDAFTNGFPTAPPTDHPLGRINVNLDVINFANAILSRNVFSDYLYRLSRFDLLILASYILAMFTPLPPQQRPSGGMSSLTQGNTFSPSNMIQIATHINSRQLYQRFTSACLKCGILTPCTYHAFLNSLTALSSCGALDLIPLPIRYTYVVVWNGQHQEDIFAIFNKFSFLKDLVGPALSMVQSPSAITTATTTTTATAITTGAGSHPTATTMTTATTTTSGRGRQTASGKASAKSSRK